MQRSEELLELISPDPACLMELRECWLPSSSDFVDRDFAATQWCENIGEKGAEVVWRRSVNRIAQTVVDRCELLRDEMNVCVSPPLSQTSPTVREGPQQGRGVVAASCALVSYL